MATPYDRRTISPDNLSLYSQVALGLRPSLGPLYAGWNMRRLAGYAKRTVRLEVPVISVGNLTFGGAGKTPFVLSLARHLIDRRQRVGVVGNGHGGRLRQRGALVSDGTHVLKGPDEVGDEAVLLGHALKLVGASVAVASRREVAGQLLLERRLATVLILDDGFQYRSLHRDADLVLIDATNPFGAGNQEDFGFMREPLAALSRATAILLTKTNLLPLLDLPEKGRAVHRDWLHEQLDRVVPDSIPRLEVPLIEPHLERVWHPAEMGKIEADPIADPLHPPKEALRFPLARPDLPDIDDPARPQRLLPISGIGNPEAFEATCRLHDLQISQPVRYEDHYRYGLGDLIWWNQLIARSQFEGIVVTSKDWIKIHPMRKALQMPCWVLTAEMQVPEWSSLLPAALAL